MKISKKCMNHKKMWSLFICCFLKGSSGCFLTVLHKGHKSSFRCCKWMYNKALWCQILSAVNIIIHKNYHPWYSRCSWSHIPILILCSHPLRLAPKLREPWGYVGMIKSFMLSRSSYQHHSSLLYISFSTKLACQSREKLITLLHFHT